LPELLHQVPHDWLRLCIEFFAYECFVYACVLERAGTVAGIREHTHETHCVARAERIGGSQASPPVNGRAAIVVLLGSASK
jgi:hypothetical protein